jgi:PPP family 3-phenylpropionic acid transporter
MVGIAIFARAVPDCAHTPHADDHLPVWQVVRRPEVAALLAGALLMAFTHGPYYTFYSIHLVEHGYDKSTVGWLWALGVICEIGVFLVAPRLFARFGARRLLLVSFAAAVLRFVVIGWLIESVWLTWAAQTLHAFTFGTYHAAAVALVHKYFRGRHQARGQALYTSLSYGVGGTLGGLASGWAWEPLGAGFTFGMAAASAAAAFVIYGVWGRERRA